MQGSKARQLGWQFLGGAQGQGTLVALEVIQPGHPLCVSRSRACLLGGDPRGECGLVVQAGCMGAGRGQAMSWWFGYGHSVGPYAWVTPFQDLGCALVSLGGALFGGGGAACAFLTDT